MGQNLRLYILEYSTCHTPINGIRTSTVEPGKRESAVLRPYGPTAVRAEPAHFLTPCLTDGAPQLKIRYLNKTALDPMGILVAYYSSRDIILYWTVRTVAHNV